MTDDLGYMGIDYTRKAIVTDEHREEARKLKLIWDRKPRMEQGAFGKAYEIGGQSAVSNFLRGRSALSLKAARGFARGLGCDLAEFTPRLAAEAAKNVEAAPDVAKLSPESIAWALRYEKASTAERAKFRMLLMVAVNGASPDHETWTRPDADRSPTPGPMEAGDSGLSAFDDALPEPPSKRTKR